MAEHSSELAAAVLEHSERIRLLTAGVERQGRSLRRLSYFVGFLIVLQILSLVFYQSVALFLRPAS
jgi:hypothetical protein